jgi:hypothetical protein
MKLSLWYFLAADIEITARCRWNDITELMDLSLKDYRATRIYRAPEEIPEIQFGHPLALVE